MTISELSYNYCSHTYQHIMKYFKDINLFVNQY